MLLDKHDFHRRHHFYQLNNLDTLEDKWAELPDNDKRAIRLVVENACDASVYPSPRNISSFLLERLGIWVSADEVQAVLLNMYTDEPSDTGSFSVGDRYAITL